jgi:hypothetical protein
MYATNPVKSRTRKAPLRDVKPKRSFYLKDEINKTLPQYQLLIATVRKTLFGAHLPAWWTYESDPSDLDGKQRVSHLMNDLIDTGVSQSRHLLRRGLTAKEKTFLQSVGDWNTDYEILVPLPDSEVVRQAKAIAGKLARDTMIIRRPYKLDESGNRILDAKKQPKRAYQSEIKVAHPTQDKNPDNGELMESWTSPLANHAVGVTGNPVEANPTKGYDDATNQMVDLFMTQAFDGVLRDFLGEENTHWLLDYYNSIGDGQSKTDPERRRACYLMKILKDHQDELRDFLCLLT